jgi:hypothetical protein
VGEHRVQWNGARYASGVYFTRISAGGFHSTAKLLLLK